MTLSRISLLITILIFVNKYNNYNAAEFVHVFTTNILINCNYETINRKYIEDTYITFSELILINKMDVIYFHKNKLIKINSLNCIKEYKIQI